MSKEWNTETLGKIITLQRGYDLPHRQRKQGTVPIITSSGLGDTHSEYKVAGPGVVTGRYGTIGEVFFIQENFWPLNTTLYVKDFQGNDPLYISYLLRTIDFHSHSGKSGVPGVNRNDLHELVVTLPPTKAEQEAIAEALSDADALLESLTQLIAKKRQLKQGAMQELLTGKRRLHGFANATSGYKQTEVGVIPEDWELKTLGKVCVFENGDRGINYPSPKSFVHSGIPFVNAGHIAEGHINRNDLDFITQESYNRLGSGKFKSGDILFCLRGSLGKFGVIAPDFGEGAIASSLVIVRHKSQELYGNFLICYLNSHLCTQMIEKWSGGAAQPNLGVQDLAKFLIPLPNKAEQEAIAEVLSEMDAEITVLETKLAKARQLKQGMMHNLLTGRIRLV